MLNYRNLYQRMYYKSYRDWMLAGMGGPIPRLPFLLDYDTAFSIQLDVALELQDLPAPDMNESDAA